MLKRQTTLLMQNSFETKKISLAINSLNTLYYRQKCYLLKLEDLFREGFHRFLALLLIGCVMAIHEVCCVVFARDF